LCLFYRYWHTDEYERDGQLELIKSRYRSQTSGTTIGDVVLFYEDFLVHGVFSITNPVGWIGGIGLRFELG